MVTFNQTIMNIRADFQRRVFLEQKPRGLLSLLTTLFNPGMVSVLMYRLSRFCVHHHLQLVSKLLVIFEHVYARNEISPYADIGPGLVLNGMGIGIVCNSTIGKNCTFLGLNTITLGGMEGFDLQHDRFEIGDYCVFGVGARIIRPIKLDAGTQVMPNSIVLSSEPLPGATLAGIPAKTIYQSTPEQSIAWNPLLGSHAPMEAMA